MSDQISDSSHKKHDAGIEQIARDSSADSSGMHVDPFSEYRNGKPNSDVSTNGKGFTTVREYDAQGQLRAINVDDLITPENRDYQVKDGVLTGIVFDGPDGHVVAGPLGSRGHLDPQKSVNLMVLDGNGHTQQELDIWPTIEDKIDAKGNWEIIDDMAGLTIRNGQITDFREPKTACYLDLGRLKKFTATQSQETAGAPNETP